MSANAAKWVLGTSISRPAVEYCKIRLGMLAYADDAAATMDVRLYVVLYQYEPCTGTKM